MNTFMSFFTMILFAGMALFVAYQTGNGQSDFKKEVVAALEDVDWSIYQSRCNGTDVTDREGYRLFVSHKQIGKAVTRINKALGYDIEQSIRR